MRRTQFARAGALSDDTCDFCGFKGNIVGMHHKTVEEGESHIWACRSCLREIVELPSDGSKVFARGKLRKARGR